MRGHRTLAIKYFAFIACIAFSAPRARAGVMEFMSRAAYNILPGGESCEAVDETKALAAVEELENCVAPASTLGIEKQLADIAAVNERLRQPRPQGKAEDRFFALLARENQRELGCASGFSKELIKNDEAVTHLRNRFLALRDAKRTLTSKVERLSSPSYMGPRLCPMTIEELRPNPNIVAITGRDEGYELCRELIAARTAVKILQDGIPLIGSPEVFELADKIGVEDTVNPQDIDRRIREAYRAAGGAIQNSAEHIENVLKTQGGAGFNRSERSALMSDPALVQKVLNLSPQSQPLRALACDANAAYGAGADKLRTTLLVGSLLFGGGVSLAGRLGVGAVRIVTGVDAARAAGTVTFNAANAIKTAALFSLGAATGVTEGLAAIEQVDRACLSKNTMRTFAPNACIGAPRIDRLEQDNCILAASLSTLGIGATVMGVRVAGRAGEALDAERAAARGTQESAEEAAAAAPSSGSPDRRRGLNAPLATSATREQFKAHYLRYEAASLEQNERWVSFATGERKGATRFIELENWKLRDLNKTLQDKDLATALTNRHKEITMEEFDALRAKYPNLKFHPYSDYKSVRFAIEGDVPPGFDADLQKTFARIQTRFTADLKTRNLVRADEDPADWFRAASGASADEAAVVARWARDEGDAMRMASAQDPAVRAKIEENLRRTDELRREAVARVADTGMVERSSEGHLVLEKDVMEIMRKAKDDKEAAEMLRLRYGLSSLTPEQAGSLRRYAQAADKFSPSLYVVRREVATLDDAESGGFSIDFVGMGASNLQSTANALAGTRSLDAALLRTRQAEKDVTAVFEGRRRSVTEVARSIFGPERVRTVCSGDDCVGVLTSPLTESEKLRLANTLASQQDGANIRMAYIPPYVQDRGARSILATHGESVEKIMRTELVGRMETTRLRGLLFAIDVKSYEPGTGGMGLVVGRSPNLRLSPSEEKMIQEAFRKAVGKLNGELYGAGSGYRTF